MKMNKKNDGFLLVEALVAISILAFGLVYISRALTNCLNAMGQIAHYTRAVNLAEEKFFDCLMQKAALRDEGNNFSDEQNFRYAVTINGLGDLGLQEADIRVSWKEGRREGSFEINSYLPVKNE